MTPPLPPLSYHVHFVQTSSNAPMGVTFVDVPDTGTIHLGSPAIRNRMSPEHVLVHLQYH